MKTLWYYCIKFYVKIGLFFTLKKIKVFGKENIPKKGAVLFIGNHQNALIDALLIPATNSRRIYFLTRASAFKNKLTKVLLSTVNMIPVYRFRDGFKTLKKNQEVFERCTEILKLEQAIEIFAEGEHHIEKRILPLKKGFAKIILASLKKYPNLQVQIVPVGINYDNPLKYPCSVSLYYGNPIIATNFIDLKNVDLKFVKLKNEVANALKKLTVHIENFNQYDEIIKKLDKVEADYLNPIKTNILIKNIDELAPIKSYKKSKINWLAPIYFITKINSLIPLLIWKYLKANIKDAIFLNTFRFALITTIFPLFYVVQTWLIYYYFDLKIAIIYLISCIGLGIITSKTVNIT